MKPTQNAAIVFASLVFASSAPAADPPPRYPSLQLVVDESSYVNAVAVGTLGGDSLPDLLVGAQNIHFIRVYHGTGGGRFTQTSTIPVFGCAGLALGDANGDGAPDAVVANDQIRLALGNHQGAFSPFVPLAPVAAGFEQPALADLDGDGDLDIAAIDSGTGKMQFLFGNGLGAFPTASTLSPVGASQIFRFALADVNGDAKLDLIAGAWVPNGLTISAGNGDGTFQAPQPLAIPGLPARLALGDIDGDSDLDLAVGFHNPDDVRFFRNDGNLQFTPAGAAIPTFEQGSIVALTDLDHDGVLDVAAGTGQNLSAHGFRLMRARGNGNFTFGPLEYSIVNSDFGGVAALADVDVDGLVDAIAVSKDAVTITRGDAMNGFASAELLVTGATTGETGGPIAAGDLDGDGRDDLVMPTYVYQVLECFYSAGAPVGFTPVMLDLGPGLWQSTALEIADLNGDSHPDLFKVNATPTIFTLLNDGTGSFGSSTLVTLQTAALDVALADIDQDADIDFVAATAPLVSTSTVGTFRNDGAAHFAGVQTVIPPGNARFVALGDLDSDGAPELMVSVQSGATASMRAYKNDGIGFFPAVTATLPQGPNAGSMELADLDLDGALDLVANGSSTGITIAFGKGDGTFKLPTPVPIPGTQSTQSTDVFRVADVDGDGFLEVIFTNLHLRVGIARGNGAGGFAPVDYYARAQGGDFVATDANADGARDLVFAALSVPAFLNRAHDGTVLVYGKGCPGSAGAVPELRFGGVPGPSQASSVSVTHGLGGSTAFLFAGGGKGSIPLPSGCSLFLSPLFPGVLVPLPLSGIAPGTGAASLAVVLPPYLVDTAFTIQAFVLDAGVVYGYSATNGIEVSIAQ